MQESTSEILSGFGQVAEGVMDQTDHHLQYMLMTIVFLRHLEKSIPALLEVINKDGNSSGYKINNSKSFIIDLRGCRKTRIYEGYRIINFVISGADSIFNMSQKHFTNELTLSTECECQ